MELTAHDLLIDTSIYQNCIKQLEAKAFKIFINLADQLNGVVGADKSYFLVPKHEKLACYIHRRFNLDCSINTFKKIFDRYLALGIFQYQSSKRKLNLNYKMQPDQSFFRFDKNDKAIIENVSPSASLIYSQIRKQTKQFGKEEIKISQESLLRHTAIKSKQTIKKAIDELIEMKAIEVDKRHRKIDSYRINTTHDFFAEFYPNLVSKIDESKIDESKIEPANVISCDLKRQNLVPQTSTFESHNNNTILNPTLKNNTINNNPDSQLEQDYQLSKNFTPLPEHFKNCIFNCFELKKLWNFYHGTVYHAEIKQDYFKYWIDNISEDSQIINPMGILLSCMKKNNLESAYKPSQSLTATLEREDQARRDSNDHKMQARNFNLDVSGIFRSMGI